MQLCVSSAHVMSVDVLVQMGPLVTHAGTSSHVHCCVPGFPVQAWCVPHVAVLVTSRQPFASAAHVTTVEAFVHTVPVVVHAGLLLQVHAAEPGFPVHVWFEAHVVVPVTVRHPFASGVQVATVEVFSQTGPEAVHAAALLQTHCAEPALPLHTWFAPHGTAVPYA
jgi:hypothetical protein